MSVVVVLPGIMTGHPRLWSTLQGIRYVIQLFQVRCSAISKSQNMMEAPPSLIDALVLASLIKINSFCTLFLLPRFAEVHMS